MSESVTIAQLTPDDVPRMRALNTLFGEAFADPETYGAEPPSDAYLRGLLGQAHNIVLTASVGDTVAEDDPLVILESMKMEIPLLAPQAGVVREILVVEGEPIAEGDVAVILG